MNDQPPTARDRTVLIVEDDRGLRDFWEASLRREGFHTETASDGVEAVEKIRGLRPDAVVLDLMLPKYGGFEMLYELRGKETAAIPLIIVTGRYTSAADRAAIVKQPNVAEYFQKPIRPEVLLDALRKTLRLAPPAS